MYRPYAWPVASLGGGGGTASGDTLEGGDTRVKAIKSDSDGDSFYRDEQKMVVSF